jgi:Phytanoyl-CoA dioxygenase (PhyH)
MMRDMLDAGTFAGAACATAQCKRHYDEQGWVLLRGFFDMAEDILPIHEHVNHLIDLKLAALGLTSKEATGKHTIRSADYLAVCAASRTLGGEIYRACRHLSPLHSLSAKPELLALAKTLMATDFLNFIPYTAMRIDQRGEEQYLFPWHQDYPYTQGSMDGIVVWIPLFDLAEGEGGVTLIPGSHRLGLQRVVLVDPDNVRRNGAHTLRIENMERFDTVPALTAKVKAGDALVFSTLLIHKSIPMEQGSVRWTTQVRYANFSYPDAVRRGWPGGMIEGENFERLHPEYIAGESRD